MTEEPVHARAANIVGGARNRGKRSSGNSGPLSGPNSGRFSVAQDGVGMKLAPGIVMFVGIVAMVSIIMLHFVTRFQNAVAK